jgi:hypothetical protein
LKTGAGEGEQLATGLVCHVRRGKADDLARLARFLNGNAIG